MGLISSFLLSLFLLFSNFQGIRPNPATGKAEVQLITEQEEAAMGEELYPMHLMESGGPIEGAPRWVTNYVSALGQKIASVSDRPNLPFEFVVVKNPDANAWCLPGGKIAINTGLFKTLDTEGQLAYILSHEVSHATARHEARTIENEVLSLGSDDAIGPVLALFSQTMQRSFEREADAVGLRYLHKAGYDPKAALEVSRLFMKLPHGKKKGIPLFASHPSNRERARLAKLALKEMPKGGKRNSPEFLAVKKYIEEHC